MPRLRRVLETALYCDDLARTAAFYTALLDKPPMLETERVVAFDAGEGTVLLLFKRGESNKPLETSGGVVPPHHGEGPAHFAFAIDAGDAPRWAEKLKALGIVVETRVDWLRGGESVYFRDPDGHSVELATPGVWPSY